MPVHKLLPFFSPCLPWHVSYKAWEHDSTCTFLPMSTLPVLNKLDSAELHPAETNRTVEQV